MILYIKIELRILHFSNQVRENSIWNSIEIVILGTRDQPILTQCDSAFPNYSRTPPNDHIIRIKFGKIRIAFFSLRICIRVDICFCCIQFQVDQTSDVTSLAAI